MNQGEARSRRPIAGDLRDVLTTGGPEPVPQICGGCIGKGMRFHIAANAVAEHGRAQIRLEHTQNRLTLAVGDRGIEGVGGLQLVRDVLLDRRGIRQRVGLHRPFLIFVRLLPPIPGGIAQRGFLRSHPRGEALVQPQIVPPRHRHQIAVPLMRHLVRLGLIDVLLLRHRAGRRQQQRLVCVGDRSPVFHRA